jgi:VWFA-related protein
MAHRLVAWFLVLSTSVVVCAGQAPVIRSSTDLFRVDVDVVDRDGNPIAGLTPDQFDVEIAGRKHAVQIADFVVFRPGSQAAPLSPSPTPAPLATSPSASAADRPQRLFMIAVDAQSFRPEGVHGLAVTVQQFVRTLGPDDLVGLYTYPVGPKVEPTTEHASVVAALDTVTGQKLPTRECNIRNSDYVDWYATPAERPVIASRYKCPGVIFNVEIETRVGMLEAQAQATLGSLRALVDGLSLVPGRKVLVLVTAGLPTADRPGGRPDIGDLPLELGQVTARANVSLHTIFVDNSVLGGFSAEERQRPSGVNLARDTDLAERWADLFTGAAGGAFSKVLTGSGEQAFDRLARESSAYYLLGIDVAARDRTGRPLRMTVKVRQKGVTVRYRPWVLVPAITYDGR